MLLFCDVSDCVLLFDKTWHSMSDDIAYRLQEQNNILQIARGDGYLKDYVLQYIEASLQQYSASFTYFNLQPPSQLINSSSLSANRLHSEELSYDFNALEKMEQIFYPSLISERKKAFSIPLLILFRSGNFKPFLFMFMEEQEKPLFIISLL